MPSLLQNLRETNGRMTHWFQGIFTADDQPVVATPEQMAAILSELLRTGGWLRAAPIPPIGDNPELHSELERYRQNVLRLHALMPSIHRELLAERARLEGQRSRVRAAEEWFRASRRTF